jgi:hypothetical protein
LLSSLVRPFPRMMRRLSVMLCGMYWPFCLHGRFEQVIQVTATRSGLSRLRAVRGAHRYPACWLGCLHSANGAVVRTSEQAPKG